MFKTTPKIFAQYLTKLSQNVHKAWEIRYTCLENNSLQVAFIITKTFSDPRKYTSH